MSWISEKLFGKRQSYEEKFANNLYDAMVLNGGPSANAESNINTIALGIPLEKWESFALKRLNMLEALLFVATNVATMAERDDEAPSFKPEHPVAVQLGKHLQNKWAERGLVVADHHVVGERCFDEVAGMFEKPFRWGRAWLDEFYDDPEESGEHYILWTEQCLQEFQAMREVVEQYV